MSAAQSYPWFHSNRYTAEAACEHCEGVVRREPWCITRNSRVMNAWEAVLDPADLDLHDHLILHALGAAWKTLCKGTCPSPHASAPVD